MTLSVSCNRFYFPAAVFVFASAAVPALAEDGPYVSVFGGASFQLDQDSDSETAADIDVDFDTGFVVGGSVGYRFDDVLPFGGVRVELEGAYRENDADEVEVATADVAFTGDNSSSSLLVNALIDFNPPIANVRPYLGIGIGGAGTESDVVLTDAGLEFGGNTDINFAWQAIAGVSVPLPYNLELFGDVRYFRISGVDFETSAVGSDVILDEFNAEYESVQTLAGLRYSF
ncbi:MAG: outer membrane beta-barrel protein [Pseudomonadota bacterium]